MTSVVRLRIRYPGAYFRKVSDWNVARRSWPEHRGSFQAVGACRERIRLAERHQDLPSVVEVEEINGCRVFSFDEVDLQSPHEPGRRHPEIIPHQHDRLDMLAIAVPQGGDKFRVLVTSAGVQPLLELVQDQQHLTLRWQDATSSQVR